MKLKTRIFSDKEVNTGRQQELDLARAFIIFCLAIIHVTIECTSDEGLASGIPYLFDTIIGGPFSAPMYMFVMGIGMKYTSANTPKQYFKRGLHIFIVGYILNLCRFFIPYLIGAAVTGDRETYITPLLYKVFCNDILIFAGLSMIIIAWFLWLKLSNLAMIIIATIMCGLGTWLNGVDVGSPLGNIFIGYIIGTEDKAGLVLSDFPIMNWMLIPVCGYVFGSYLRRVKNKRLFYQWVSIPAILIAIVYFTNGIYKELGMFGEGQNCYYHMIFPDVLASLALTIGMIGVHYVLSMHLPKKMQDIVFDISRNITTIYCIHWVLVSYVVNVVMYIVRGTTLLTPGEVVILGSIISIISILVAHYYRKFRERGKLDEKIS